MPRLALGTVQFGADYGVANLTGQVTAQEARRILEFARARGVDLLDTAIAYGTSEQVLGDMGVCDFNVVSKLPPVPPNCEDVVDWTLTQVSESLTRLKIPKLYGLLVHRPEQLVEPVGPLLRKALQLVKEAQLAEKIGVSIYDPKSLDALWGQLQLDLVQAPLNPIDRRLATSGWLDKLNDWGVEVHVRSIFLQGLLLANEAQRPCYFVRWQPLWLRWRQWLRDMRVEPLEACVSHALTYSSVARIVVGVDSLLQLEQVISAVEEPLELQVPDDIQSDDVELLNPFLWPGRR